MVLLQCYIGVYHTGAKVGTEQVYHAYFKVKSYVGNDRYRNLEGIAYRILSNHEDWKLKKISLRRVTDLHPELALAPITPSELDDLEKICKKLLPRIDVTQARGLWKIGRNGKRIFFREMKTTH